jgi:heterodisulfide reductase subunit D
MNKIKIILFVCNWGPHTAFQNLFNQGRILPEEIKTIRIPCTGRITKALLFKAFELGADGVGLIGCSSGSCRYGNGTETAIRHTEDTRQILELIGIGKERLKVATFLPDENRRLYDFLLAFHNEISALGKSPIMPDLDSAETAETSQNPKSIADIITQHDVHSCLDCGKCSSSCTLALSGKSFSPRMLANSIIHNNIDTANFKKDVWSCLTCGLCYDRCPSAVNFPNFIKDLRSVFFAECGTQNAAHGGFFQSLMRAMTSDSLVMNRWEWLPHDLKLDSDNKIAFFGGCAPYFDTFFNKTLGVNTKQIIIDSIRLLNFFDIHPRLLDNERCCGHDLLWSGDFKNFQKLAQLNVKYFQQNEIEEIITTCPECFRTLRHDYNKLGLNMDIKITHLHDYLNREIEKGAVAFKKLDKKITFQDSCRQSRLDGQPELPRMLLKRLKAKSFKEMKETGISAVCCGNSAWTGCDSFSKALQMKRLKQVHETESNLLVTACPKCQIHLRCAMEDPVQGDNIKIELLDLVSLVARTIYWA